MMLLQKNLLVVRTRTLLRIKLASLLVDVAILSFTHVFVLDL
jgi:hypothetical protein